MTISKKKIAHLLRNARLLELVGHLLFLKSILKYRKANNAFLKQHPDFVPPPAHLAFDAYSHTSWPVYYNTGLKNSSLIAGLIRTHVKEKEIKICEWGCGPARLIRHLGNIEGFDRIELFATDYNAASIAWCKENMKKY